MSNDACNFKISILYVKLIKYFRKIDGQKLGHSKLICHKMGFLHNLYFFQGQKYTSFWQKYTSFCQKYTSQTKYFFGSVINRSLWVRLPQNHPGHGHPQDPLVPEWPHQGAGAGLQPGLRCQHAAPGWGQQQETGGGVPEVSGQPRQGQGPQEVGNRGSLLPHAGHERHGEVGGGRVSHQVHVRPRAHGRSGLRLRCNYHQHQQLRLAGEDRAHQVRKAPHVAGARAGRLWLRGQEDLDAVQVRRHLRARQNWVYNRRYLDIIGYFEQQCKCSYLSEYKQKTMWCWHEIFEFLEILTWDTLTSHKTAELT